MVSAEVDAGSRIKRVRAVARRGQVMNKLMIVLIASTFAATAAAQTGTVNTSTVGDHGTPAMHAAESQKNVNVSKLVKGLTDTKARQQAVKDTTKGADHGTPGTHAADAQQNTNVSKGMAKPITSDKAGQDAVKVATKDAKP
jgi:hypothetical protein